MKKKSRRKERCPELRKGADGRNEKKETKTEAEWKRRNKREMSRKEGSKMKEVARAAKKKE